MSKCRVRFIARRTVRRETINKSRPFEHTQTEIVVEGDERDGAIGVDEATTKVSKGSTKIVAAMDVHMGGTSTATEIEHTQLEEVV
ncbi:hypothetical protein Scep_029231 [Stephania cephalantha]|uniref:Uncharacterized protein n=1 Tax=Stephania cephalantha TaxID=152367 RepID=A0AAP0E085_9MAGN